MRYLLIVLALLLSLTGCEDKEQQAAHDAQIAQQARADLLAELEAEKLRKEKASQEKNETNLCKMGVHMDDGVITIDTNKTKAFFKDFNQKMSVKMQKISDDLEKGVIETKEAGVEINEQYMHIDFNKTQDVLQEWGKRMQVFVQEFDEVARSLEINASNTTNKGIQCNP